MFCESDDGRNAEPCDWYVVSELSGSDDRIRRGDGFAGGSGAWALVEPRGSRPPWCWTTSQARLRDILLGMLCGCGVDACVGSG